MAFLGERMLRTLTGVALAIILILGMLATTDASTAQAQSANEVDALNRQVVQLTDEGKYGEATMMAERTLTLAENSLGKEHPSTLASVNNLAQAYVSQGRYAEAEPLHRRVLAGAERVLGPDHLNVGTALNNLGSLLQAQGRYAEAEPLYRRALTITEKALGSDHSDVGITLNNLAGLFEDQGRHAEAEPLYLRTVAIFEKAMGADHPDVGVVLNNLASLFQSQGRYTEAEPLYQRTLGIIEKGLGLDHPAVGARLNNLADLYQDQGRYAEAEPLYKRTVANFEKALGPDHPDVGTAVSNLAGLFQAQGRYLEVEPLLRRALAIAEKSLGPDHRDVGTRLNNLAGIFSTLGRYAEAEPLFQRALTIAEKVLGPEHADVGARLNSLGTLYYTQARYAEAEPLLRRALAITEEALGSDHPDVGIKLNNLALVYNAQRRHAEAVPLFQRALAVTEKVLGPDHPDVAIRLNSLAMLYHDQGRYAEAEPLFLRALVTTEKALGSDHPNFGTRLNNLALLYDTQGRYVDAEQLYQRSLAVTEKALGSDHPDVGSTLNNLAVLYFVQRDWVRAAEYWRRSAAVIVQRTQRGTEAVGQDLTGKRTNEAEQSNWRFRGLIKAVHRIGAKSSAANLEMRETFQTAQWALSSEAAMSLTQMAVRGAKGDPALAALVRERQDRVVEWQHLDGLRGVALGKTKDKRNARVEEQNLARLADIDTRIAEIDARLAAEFPDYAALASPEPLSVEVAQAQLRVDEALVLFLDTHAWDPTPQETFMWVVTKTDARWVRSDLGTAALTRDVGALRCGMDEEEWATSTGATRCAELLGLMDTADPAQSMPFDLGKAHALYRGLFGQIEELIKGKHLLIVPSGPLTQLPFQVLVTAPPTKDDHKSAAWLARDHALTVLPAVSSLKALRRVARPSTATKPMIGFGNPLLDGPSSRYAKLAQRARDNQHCRDGGFQSVAAIFSLRGVTPIQLGGGLANVSHIREQAPLPETADELCAVARDLQADVDEMRLGARATERNVKALSESGQLADYRVVHFATHGAMAGQLSAAAEPGLLLTPPADASAEDDGYLSASEIASLKLDADWVILSACNTAAGDAPGAQALSGLARAFFYAQARALLVSHWAVNSNTTVKLVTWAMREMGQDEGIGRAEALRRAMLALIDKGNPQEAHPAHWAPFIVVGEGAR